MTERMGLTEQDFMNGNPAELMQATNRPSVYAMWPHGSEVKLGPRVGYALYADYPHLLAHVDYECGNPQAVFERVMSDSTDPSAGRYTDKSKGGTDLNRSFDPSIVPKSYEEHRAVEILQKVRERDYDYVLDLHTTTTDVGRCIIVSEEFFGESAVREIISASPISRIVVFPQEIAVAGLIGNVPQSISIEYNHDVAQKVGVQETIETIEGLVTGQPQHKGMEREVFSNVIHIPKSEDPGPDARNFERTAAGYFPFLYGANSYRTDPTKSYLGFGALTRTPMSI